MMMQLERYRIESEIGRGGMATVYRAYDTQAGRYVALKLLHRQYLGDATIRARFIQEAKTVAQLRHPAIVPILHAAQVGEDIFLVMPLMAGGSLADRLRHGPLTVVESLNMLERIAPALDYAHEQGVVHRDVKPDNILFDDSGQAYLGDFGIIKLVESNLTMTSSGLIGTPAYMSPEQIQAVNTLDGRTDIYALGVVLFESLAGRLPYTGDSEMSIAIQHVNAPIPNVRDFIQSLAPGWQKIINKAMAKKPEDRYQTGAELLKGVNGLVNGRPGMGQPAGKTVEPQAGGVLRIALAMLALLVLGGGAIFLLTRIDPGRIVVEVTPATTVMVVEVVITATAPPATTAAPTTVPVIVDEPVTPTSTQLPTSTRIVSRATTATAGVLTVRVLRNVFTREGPGLNFPILGSLNQGEDVPLIARNRDASWFLVQARDRSMAWVPARFVTTPPGGSSAVALAATIPAPPVVINTTATTTTAQLTAPTTVAGQNQPVPPSQTNPPPGPTNTLPPPPTSTPQPEEPYPPPTNTPKPEEPYPPPTSPPPPTAYPYP